MYFGNLQNEREGKWMISIISRTNTPTGGEGARARAGPPQIYIIYYTDLMKTMMWRILQRCIKGAVFSLTYLHSPGVGLRYFPVGEGRDLISSPPPSKELLSPSLDFFTWNLVNFMWNPVPSSPAWHGGWKVERMLARFGFL